MRSRFAPLASAGHRSQAAAAASDIERVSGQRRDLIGWRSPVLRSIVLTLGWALAITALVSTIGGIVIGTPVLSLAGALIGCAAWAIAKVLPEPVPAPRKAERRRTGAVRQYSGHQLPT